MQDLSALKVGKPAAWLMALPALTANAVCAAAYLVAAVLIHGVFALPNALVAAGSAASGVAVAGALMCGPKVLPGLWLGRLLWEIALKEGPTQTADWGLAALAATAMVVQTELARSLVLKLHILPSKLRRLRKSLHIGGAGLLSVGVGTAVYLGGLALTDAAPPIDHWGLLAAGVALPEWAGIAILLPLTILWLQDDAWREARKWRVTGLVALAAALSLALTARAVWTDEQQTLVRLHDAHQALAERLQADLGGAGQAVQIMQSHLSGSTRQDAASFARVAETIQAGHPYVYALSWNPVFAHAQRENFERELRKGYGAQAALFDRDAQGLRHPSAVADTYVAVQFIAPLERNRAAVGLNIYSHPARRAAIEQAVKSGQPAITPRIQLAQETGTSWGALYLSPLFAGERGLSHPAKFPLGFTVAVLRMEDLVGDAVEALQFSRFRLPSGESPRRKVVHYRFVDIQDPTGPQTLYVDTQDAVPAPSNPLLQTRLLALEMPTALRQELVFADRRYAIEAIPGGDFWLGELSRTPFFALGAGTLLTWVALAASLMLTGSTQLLTIAVDRRTQQLQQADAALQATNVRLQRQSLQLRSVLEALDQGYMGFDAQGSMVLCNEKGFELIDLAPGDARQHYTAVASHIGRHFQLAQAQALSVAQSMLRVRTNEEHHVYRNLVPVRPGATARFIDMQVHTFEDPGLRTIVLLHDTTPDMQLERSKAQFMSFAAHEIRTPLTIIHGYADLLATRPHDALRVQDMGQHILRKSQALNHLLQRMLDLSELDMNGLDAQRIRFTDLRALCVQAAQGVEIPEGRQRPTIVHHEPVPWCRVDPAAITMAIRELLHNAYAFSPAGTDVTLTVEPLHQNPDTPGGVRVRIRDAGQGMTHEVQKHIFERFYRADSSGKQPGFGLGLSTAKLIADLHKARLHIHSSPSQGTEVELEIPQGEA